MSEKVKHEGFWSNRLKYDNPRELAFAERWKKENELGNILAHLLTKTKGMPLSFNLYDKVEHLAPYDQQSASIAATVIQWLGSNVGFNFLRISLENCGYTIKEKEERRP